MHKIIWTKVTESVLEIQNGVENWMDGRDVEVVHQERVRWERPPEWKPPKSAQKQKSGWDLNIGEMECHS